MADQTGPARGAGESILDQAAADGSIADARHRAVDPVPIVTDGAEIATLDTVGGDGRQPAPAAAESSFRWRRLSPRPVPGNRRKRPPKQAIPATDEEPTPAEEMDDVGTHDDEAAKAADAEKAVTPSDVEAEETSAPDSGARGATLTKSAKPQTAAEIVAAQKAKAAAEADGDTAMTKPVPRQPAAASTPTTGTSGAAGNKPGSKTPAGNPLVSAKAAREDKGRAAMSRVGSGVTRLRNLVASLVWLIAVVAAAVLALGALFTALDQANQSNEIVRWVLERGHDLVGPFKDLFRLETAKNTLLVNWGIAALVYLIAGKLIERFIRP